MAEPAPAAAAFSAIADIYDRVMARVPYADWVEYVQLLCRHWRGDLKRVLDVACGTGTVGLALAELGAEVVGVDLARGMLAAARRKDAARGGSPCLWVRADMSALSLAPESFDVAICLFDSLNYLLELDQLRATLLGVRHALTRDGLFIFDVNTEYALEQDFFSQEDLGDEAEVRLSWRGRFDARSRIATVDMDFYLDGGQTLKETHRQRAYSPRELRDSIGSAGLRSLAVYDAYTFNLPKRDSDRVFYVCRPV